MFRILSPERFARYATNYKADSVLVNEMEELNKGAIEKERIAMEGNKLFADFVSKYGKEYETWFGKKAKWEQVEGAEDMDGKPVYVTPAMKLSLIMHGRNDSLAAGLVSKGTGVNIGGVALGGSAYNSAYREALDRGLDTAHAQATAIASGAFEMIFETLSIERLIAIKDAKSIGQAALNALKQGGFEASEEINTKIAEMISDYVINGDMSKLSKMYEDFRDRGYSVKVSGRAEHAGSGRQRTADGDPVGGHDRAGDTVS